MSVTPIEEICIGHRLKSMLRPPEGGTTNVRFDLLSDYVALHPPKRSRKLVLLSRAHVNLSSAFTRSSTSAPKSASVMPKLERNNKLIPESVNGND